MHTRATRTDQTRAPAPARPSAVTDTPWLWVTAPGARDRDCDAHLKTTAYGKWLWFLPVRALDPAWRLVKTAVEAGQLGPGAKVATLGNGFRGDPTRRPVIIYTGNYHDEDDVRGVLLALRGLGINDALAYKTDEATERGEYGDRTSIYTSPAGTTRLICRDPKPRTGPQPTSSSKWLRPLIAPPLDATQPPEHPTHEA
ncbi:putative phosphothreonine lyase domain-containing protein [Streptomyces platensis]|uniref:putative phosphothreonine lyase domain-containing protein n=1 Tax=Streptomyces platensis TaxID=58346 RepID=UPI003C2AC80F